MQQNYYDVSNFTNVMNSMSELKFNSLKDSEGKIPLLANQLIFTEEEHSNLETNRYETIYDMNSADNRLNWEQKNGLVSTIYTGVNFSKYKSVRFFIASNPTNEWYGGQYGTNNIIEMDLTKRNGNQTIFTAVGCFPNTTTGNTSIAKVAMLYDSTNNQLRTNHWTTENSIVDTSGAYFVYKIEGILKDAAMIYTGGELINGHAISINKGEINYNSSDKFVLVAGCDTSSNTQTITGGGAMHPISVSYVEFTVPKDGVYLIMYTLVYKVNAGTSSLHLLVDTEDYTKRIANNHFSNTNPDTKVIFGTANLTKGTHVCHLVASHNQTTSSSGQVEAYTHNLCLIMEV